MASTSDSGERSRELRAQGARLDAAARSDPDGRRLEPLRKETGSVKGLGLVWVITTSSSLLVAGLRQALQGKADIYIGGDLVAESPSCIVLDTDDI